MDYIWLHKHLPQSDTNHRRVTWAECYGDSVTRYPDISVPLMFLRAANAHPKILDHGSFPLSYVAYEKYLQTAGALTRGKIRVDALTGISTKPVPLHENITREWKIKGGGTMAEWNSARDKDKILIRPLYTGKYDLTDVPVPRTGAKALSSQKYSHVGLYESAPLVTKCVYGQELRQAPGFESYVITSNSSDFFRVFSANFGLYDHTDITSIFRLQKPPIEQFVRFLDNQTHPSGLVNPTLEKLNAGVYDLLTELAELPSTVKYIYDALRRIILAFIGMKSKEVLLAKKYGYGSKEFMDELAGLWMSFRYAASPIAYSIQDAQKVLAAQQKSFITERGRKDVPFKFEADNYTFSGTLEWRCFTKAKVQGATVGLGLNPIRTLWEITPLAFVVGWVLPVGSMLSALAPPSGAQQVVASLSYRVKDVTITFKHGEETYTVPNKIDIYKVTPVSPTAEFDLWPQVHLDWKRGLDALALSWSMFLKQFWKSK